MLQQRGVKMKTVPINRTFLLKSAEVPGGTVQRLFKGAFAGNYLVLVEY